MRSCLAAVFSLPVLSLAVVAAQDSTPSLTDEVAAALVRAGSNAAEIRRALDEAPAAQRPAMQFLVANMPDRDLAGLTAGFLLDDVQLAFAARDGAPWRDRISDDLFLDAILPYANVTESREPWRAKLRELCLPMIEGCTSPGDAAQRINQKLFAELSVRYSTERKRADQSPSESIEQGVASCTGLSILLADACRSVGVPARLAGIASWPNKRGNHTWVEIWDGERWRFTGACEFDPNGLDRAWFVADAALASSDDPREAIWAVVWRKTGARFPLAWRRGLAVNAIDVTPRYARAPELPAGAMRLMLDVRDGTDGPRVAAQVELAPAGAEGDSHTGTTRDESADTNDHLEFVVPRGSAWLIRVAFAGHDLELPHTCVDDAQQLVIVHFPPRSPGEDALRDAASAFFAADDDSRGRVVFAAAADALVTSDEERARAIVWQAYRDAPMQAGARRDFDAQVVRTSDREAAYTVKTVGERPAGGYALFIAMHGGGGVPKRVNDRQWQAMQRFYTDHPEAGGYRYVALRAPNDAWNGFYDDAICPMVAELIRQFLLFGDVDPDRVFAMGYSHGGYGAFVIGPKMPDRFAAVHASAAAPTPGETVARNLRNLTFTFMVGTEDTAHGRIERCDGFAREIDALRGADPDGYRVTYERIEGNGHGGLPDRDKIAAMYPAVRDATPAVVDWTPSDDRLRDMYWITMLEPHDGQSVRARLADGVLDIDAADAGPIIAWLDRRLLATDLATLTVRRAGVTREVELTPSARVLCESLLRRGDPRLAFPIRIEIPPAGVR